MTDRITEALERSNLSFGNNYILNLKTEEYRLILAVIGAAHMGCFHHRICPTNYQAEPCLCAAGEVTKALTAWADAVLGENK